MKFLSFYTERCGFKSSRVGSLSIAAARVVTGAVQAANAVKNTFGWARNAIGNIGKTKKTDYASDTPDKLFPAAEFKKNLENIYGVGNIENLDSITSAPTVKVSLTPESISFGDEITDKITDKIISIKLLTLKQSLDLLTFQQNVLEFYKSINI